MSKESTIQWTNATVNFWTGCEKVSAGCKYCYMFRDQTRFHRDPTTVKRTSNKTFNAALNWDEPKLIFTCSWSDFFIEQADEWRADAWDVIRKTPHHTWQILTKRPERIMECLPPDWGDGWANVWFGVTVENQETTHRVHTLADIPMLPSQIRFVSAEPLLGEIFLNHPAWRKINWLIIGGESGNDTGDWRYRKNDVEWMVKLIIHARTFNPGVKIFVKQMGTYLAKQLKLKDHHGGDISEFPASLQIREMPTIARIHPKTY